MWVRLLPLLVCVLMGGFLYVGLSRDPTEIPSPLIDKPAPPFTAAVLPAPPGAASATTGATARQVTGDFDSASMLGKVWVFNVWASWCGPCIAEHPYLVAFAADHDVPLIGLNYKDAPEDAQAWLQRHGNPFDTVVSDLAGDVGLDYGVYGVPETFLIDAEGQVRYKHVGPLDAVGMEQEFLPAVLALTGSSS